MSCVGSRCRVPPRLSVDTDRCRVPPRRAGNFHLLAQMKVTKAKCLNTDLAKHLTGKSSRFFITARLRPFPRGLARRAAASYFWRLEFAPLKGKHSRSSGPAAQSVGTNTTAQRRLPAYEVAKRRRVREVTVRCTSSVSKTAPVCSHPLHPNPSSGPLLW